VGTGNKFQIETDYVSSIPGGLNYRRYYNTQISGYPGRYGVGWTADYWPRIVHVTQGDGMEVWREDGKRYKFWLENSVWVGDNDTFVQLEEIKDSQGVRTGWYLTLANDTVEEYWDDGNVGRPIAITNRTGLKTTLEYNLTSAEGGDDQIATLDRVTDAFGRTLTFHYDGNSLSHVLDPSGNKIVYERDLSGNITSVTYPDETPFDNNDNPKRLYHYEDTNFPNHLTGITDENNNRFATWAYDTQGRAISSEHANGIERIELTYNSDGSTTTTDSHGFIQTYTFNIKNGLVKLDTLTKVPCASCTNQVQNITYDANGFVATRTDFNGNVTTFIYNARGLQTSRTEAAGTPVERTITTEWHGTFRLPTKITEPGKITKFTYDTQGRLLERKEEIVP